MFNIRGRLFSTRKLGCGTKRTPIGTGAVGGDGTGLGTTAGTLQLVEEIHCLECPCNGLPCVCVWRECEIELEYQRMADEAWVKINFSREAESQSRLECSFGELLKNGF